MRPFAYAIHSCFGFFWHGVPCKFGLNYRRFVKPPQPLFPKRVVGDFRQQISRNIRSTAENAVDEILSSSPIRP